MDVNQKIYLELNRNIFMLKKVPSGYNLLLKIRIIRF